MKLFTLLLLFLMPCNVFGQHEEQFRECLKDGSIPFWKTETELSEVQKNRLGSIVRYSINNKLDTLFLDLFFPLRKTSRDIVFCERASSISAYLSKHMKAKLVLASYRIEYDQVPDSCCQDVDFVAIGVTKARNYPYLLGSLGIANVDNVHSHFGKRMTPLKCDCRLEE